MEKSVRDAIVKWASAAWPVFSHVSAEDAYRKCWGEYGESGCSFVTFKEVLQSLGFAAQLFGSVWIIRLPGPSPKMAAGAIRCEGF